MRTPLSPFSQGGRIRLIIHANAITPDTSRCVTEMFNNSPPVRTLTTAPSDSALRFIGPLASFAPLGENRFYLWQRALSSGTDLAPSTKEPFASIDLKTLQLRKSHLYCERFKTVWRNRLRIYAISFLDFQIGSSVFTRRFYFAIVNINGMHIIDTLCN